jgi:hypothetical protein
MKVAHGGGERARPGFGGGDQMRQMRQFCAIVSHQSVTAWISISIPIDSG